MSKSESRCRRVGSSVILAGAFFLTGTLSSANEGPASATSAPSVVDEAPSDATPPSDVAPAAPVSPEPPVAKPAPYSIPWQLRPILALSALRSDNVLARYENKAGTSGTTIVNALTASYKIPGTGGRGEGLAIVARLTTVNDSPPTGDGGLVLADPVVGGAFAIKLTEALRLNLAMGVALPVGGGGGDNPDPGSADARSKGPLARSGMDNAIFGINDVGLTPGIGLALVAGGVTVQVDVTLIHSIRVRGEKAQLESTKTNSTYGLHVGYFLAAPLSIGADLRYQRFINPPVAVEKDLTDATWDNVTVAVGPRFHLKIGDFWFRPGIAYARGLDKPMAASTPNYHIVQLDLPFIF